MKKIVLAVLMSASVAAFAAGGKVRTDNPIITDDGCVLSIPDGIELEDCQQIPAPEQSGVKVWFCADLAIDPVLTCLDD